MTEIRNVGQEVQAEILKTVRKSQEAVVEAIKNWSDTVRTIAPPLPDLSTPLRELSTPLRDLGMPLVDKLPKPEELVGNAYDFAEKLLAGQRKFAEQVLQLLPGNDDAPASKNGSAAK
jgi:hypothetical protein